MTTRQQAVLGVHQEILLRYMKAIPKMTFQTIVCMLPILSSQMTRLLITNGELTINKDITTNRSITTSRKITISTSITINRDITTSGDSTFDKAITISRDSTINAEITTHGVLTNMRLTTHLLMINQFLTSISIVTLSIHDTIPSLKKYTVLDSYPWITRGR